MSEIINKVHGTALISWQKLKTFEFNDLKEGKNRDVSKLKNSIVNDGFNFPFYVWKNHNYVIDGNGRQIALNELENEGFIIPELPVVEIEANTKQHAKKLVLLASSSYGKVTQESYELFIEDIDLELEDIELKIENIDFGGEENEVLEAEEDDFEVPEGGIETDIVLGDLFEIGEHRLLCGDSTDSDQVAKLMNGQKADMVFTDPPYGISYKSPSGKGKTNRGDYDIILNDDKPFNPNCLFGYCDKIVTWGANHYADKLPNSAQWLVWDKREGDAINNNSDCELAWCSFGGSARLFHHKWNGMIKASEKNEKRVHPTQKPIELIKWSFEITDAGKLILDLFLGSGSTMVAAHQLKRKCYGMELDPKYCQVILDRMIKLDKTLIVKRNGLKVAINK
jgi:DNA modification methylase